ncbi:hypothetical protein B0H13DRAFT_2274930 [Mycena leptocephala]|nr:hypothetical protein B0H13DRAFT_2274930 [Mycena leptocephala]
MPWGALDRCARAPETHRMYSRIHTHRAWEICLHTYMSASATPRLSSTFNFSTYVIARNPSGAGIFADTYRDGLAPHPYVEDDMTWVRALALALAPVAGMGNGNGWRFSRPRRAWESAGAVFTAFRGRGDRGFVSVRTHTSAQADTNLGFRHVDKAVSRSRSFHCKLTAQLSLLHAYTTSRSWCKVDHLRPHGQVDTLGFQALPRCGADVAGTAGSNPHYVFCLVYSPVGRRVEMMAVTA